jgi:hypothetical protein
VYRACGKFVQTSHASLASLGGIAENDLIFFQITGQKMVSQAAHGQELSPFGPVGGNTPTPTPAFTPTLPPPPTVQILSPTTGASYKLIPRVCSFPCPGPETFSLVLESEASAGVISYAWSDTLGLVSDSNANDTLTLAPTASQVPCNMVVKDMISLMVTDSYPQTANDSVIINIERIC